MTDIPETARFKIRVDGVASSDTTITVKALLDSSESYTAELLSSETQAEARYEGLFYRIDPGRVLASQSKDLIKSQLALDVLGHSNASGKQVGEVTIETTEDRHRRVVTCLAFEFVDHFPDYSNDGDTDCDNFFVRENNDWQGLDIFYNIPEEKLLRPSNVRMDVYRKDTTNLEIQLEGVKDGADFAKGDGLHKAWNKSDPVPYYRVQLVVAAPLMIGAAKTPIHDAKPDWGGWQCPEYGLAVHDLIWKHRPHVHTDGSRSENPTLPANFRNLSGLYLRGTGNTRTRIAGPPVTAAQLMLNNTVEHYLDRDNNDAINHGNPPLPDVTAVIHTANLQDAANHVFVQFWLFYDFSEVATNWAGRQVAGSPYHEGDVEFAQLAVRKQSVPWQSGVPYAVGDVCRASTSLAYRCKQTHTSAPGNAPPNDTYWVRYYNHKALWFQPFSATASQHYYGQTLPWLMHDGSEAALPQTQIHVQHDDENEHFSIFVAEGTHATYFRRGRFNVERADTLRTMGTQVQYTTVGGTDFSYEDAQDSALAIASWIRPDNDIETWMGLWGFKSTVAGAPFGMEDRDGPPGINRRFAVGPPPGLARLLLRPEPRQFNNACRREVGGVPEARTLIDP